MASRGGSAASMFVAIPTAIQFFSWLATLWKGDPWLRLPMLYLFGFLFVFVCGGLTGVMLALVPFNWQAHDTQFVVAHLHYVLIGGFVFPLLAAAHYWFPLMTGRTSSERLGQWAFWLIFAGFNLTFLHMHFTGLAGMPRRIPDYAIQFAEFNMISSIGGFVFGFAQLFFAYIVWQTVRGGERATAQVWDGAKGLEWTVPSPAPLHTFETPPMIDDSITAHPDNLK